MQHLAIRIVFLFAFSLSILFQAFYGAGAEAQSVASNLSVHPKGEYVTVNGARLWYPFRQLASLT